MQPWVLRGGHGRPNDAGQVQLFCFATEMKVYDLDDSLQQVSFFSYLETYYLAPKVEGVSKFPQLLYQEEQVQTGVSVEDPLPLPPWNDAHPTTKTEMEDEPQLPDTTNLPKLPKKLSFDALEVRFQRLLEIELAQSSESSIISEGAYRSTLDDVDLFHSLSSLSLEGNIENKLKYLSPQPFLAAESAKEDAHFGYHGKKILPKILIWLLQGGLFRKKQKTELLTLQNITQRNPHLNQ
jgi:hypothetical protein